MAQPTMKDVHIDVPLSNIAIGWAQDQKAFIADKATPRVPVDKQSGYYHQYKREFWFRDEAQKRAPGTLMKGGGWAMDDPGTYFAEEWGWSKVTPWEVKENADTAIKMDEADTLFITHKLLLKKEKLWVEKFFRAGLWTTTFSGVAATPAATEFIFWDNNTTATPARDIAKMKKAMKQLTGFAPNAIVVSEAVHFYLINQSDILDRYKYTQAGILTEQLIAAVLGLDEYHVAGAIENTSSEGATTQNYDFIMGNDALLYYKNTSNPSPFTPSAMYTFYWKKYGQDINMRRLSLEEVRADKIEGFIFEDYKLVSADLGIFLSNCISAAATS